MDKTHTNYSPAVWYARIVGVVLLLAGILGLIINTSQNAVEPLLGLDVNLTHNFVHLLTGIIGVAIGFYALRHSRMYALVFGVVYTVLAVWGMAEGSNFNPFDLFVRINTADHILHLALGIAGIAAWAMSRDEVNERAV